MIGKVRLKQTENEYTAKPVEQPFYIKLLQSLYEAKREYEAYNNIDDRLNFGKIQKKENSLEEIPLIKERDVIFFLAKELKLVRQGFDYFQIKDNNLKELLNHKSTEELNLATVSNKICSNNPLYYEEKETSPMYYLYLLKNNKGLSKNTEKTMYHNNLSSNKKLSFDEVNHFISDGDMARMVVLVERDFLNVVKLSKKYPDNLFITTLNRESALKKLEPILNQYLEKKELTNILFLSNETTIDQKVDYLTTEQMELAVKLTDKYYQRESDKNEIIKNIESHKLNILTDGDVKDKVLENMHNFKNWQNHYFRKLEHPSFKVKSRKKTLSR